MKNYLILFIITFLYCWVLSGKASSATPPPKWMEDATIVLTTKDGKQRLTYSANKFGIVPRDKMGERPLVISYAAPAEPTPTPEPPKERIVEIEKPVFIEKPVLIDKPVIRHHQLALVGGAGPRGLRVIRISDDFVRIRQNYDFVLGVRYSYDFGPLFLGVSGLTNRTGLMEIGKSF